MKFRVKPTWLFILPMAFPTLAFGQGAPKVGVVNIAKVFEKYQMTQQLEQQFDAKRQAISQEAQKRQDAMETKLKELEAFDPNSQDFANRQAALRYSRIEYRVWLEDTEETLKREHMNLLRMIYGLVTEAIAKTAKDRGLDLVVTQDDLSPEAPDSISLRREILLKKVLYFSPRVDITQEVLNLLNEELRAKSGAPAKPAP